MAAKLECEICGGKLIGKPGGIFECDSCGMEYSTEWAKAKIQEIKGTVKVEGTVEVTGKVQVEGAATKESLLRRAEMCCAEKSWKKVRELLEKVLEIDPECGTAYLLAAMASHWITSLEDLHAAYIDPKSTIIDDANIRHAEQYPTDTMRIWMDERSGNLKAQFIHNAENAVELERNRRALSLKTGNLIGMANSILGNHLVGVCADGHVLATGNNTDGQCDVRTWTDITAVACGAGFTVGLRADGTVLAVGDNYYGQCNVTEWQDVSAIACGDYHTVGLKKDGTLIAAGRNDDGQCNIDGWANVIKIICMGYETIALCKNGTVLCTGESLRDNDMENIKELSVGSSLLGLRKDGSVACPFQADEVRRGIDNWKDLVSAVEVEYLIYGLRKDGVIISAKQLPWEDIISIAGNEYLVGLRKDGTVVTLGNADVSDWKDVIMIRCYGPFQQTIVGVCRDGRVLATNEDFDVAGWRLFNSIDTLEQERAEGPAHAKAERIAKEKAEAKRRAQKRAALLAEQNELQTELSQLKGLFSGKRRKEIEARLTELSTALRELEEKA